MHYEFAQFYEIKSLYINAWMTNFAATCFKLFTRTISKVCSDMLIGNIDLRLVFESGENCCLQ